MRDVTVKCSHCGEGVYEGPASEARFWTHCETCGQQGDLCGAVLEIAPGERCAQGAACEHGEIARAA